ncbi:MULTISPECIES: MGH1-like glycoside hydrolase domain-containing protein [Paenibacillus]|uniref:MGH1-like glycoside hydrolase domain-containing protein n=1 Tax=Paenibacillus TaxID=44249 RepID=UPI0022B887E3|nr:trehalase family glycosidase [Paenibacillus caseinilyticus]MCZ8519539.1 trehalase family glycosidase [Paenibacillus caseinilyticus]
MMSGARRLDDVLQAGKKSLRTLPGALLLGSTGARLWADYLDPVPGFSGRFDFIHKVNIPLLFAVQSSLISSYDPCRTVWRPSHLSMDYEGNRLALSERKFITWDDCAVSCQTWTNRSREELVLRLETYGEAFGQREGGRLSGSFSIEHYSFTIDGTIAVSDPQLLDGLRVPPGESRSLVIAAAFGIQGADDIRTLSERAASYAESGRTADEVLEAQQNEYEAWFSHTPSFASSEELLDRTWSYRWFLLRHNLADPKYGNLRHPLFYEGRSHKKSKTPFGKGGWEFSKLINLSVPLHTMDARWHHDPAYALGAYRNMQASPGEDGMLSCLTVDTVMHSFANFGGWAAYQLFLVHPDKEAAAELLPALKRNSEAWCKVYANERDALMIEYKHTRTGKEYQPSYWYFHDYPRNPKDKSTYTPLKRVDRTVYHYLNLLGIAGLGEALGDQEAEHYRERAEAVKAGVLDKMWDEATQFFYDLHHETDEKAFVKNIVGFYPSWAQMLDERHDGLMGHLFDEREFATRCPFPSVSADCPAYAKEGGWMGHFVKGRNGCVWDGPTWPYTNSIALDALAKESRRRGHRYDREFGHYLREYAFLHYQQRDLNRPGLVEHYNSDTGEALSDEQEYNHSYFIDLVVSHVAGLSVGREGIVLDPLDIGLDWFDLDRVKTAGSMLRITYRRPGTPWLAPEMPEIEEGFRVYADGRLVFSDSGLTETELSWEKLRQDGTDGTNTKQGVLHI